MRIAIIGRGKVGTALQRSLSANAEHEVQLHGRDWDGQALDSAEVVVAAVPDREIASLDTALAKLLHSEQSVIHCAGALGPDALAACRDAGIPVAAMHPLVSFARRGDTPDLANKTFRIHGDRPALERAKAIVASLQAIAVARPTSGAAYHGAAALVANGAAALAHVGVDVLVATGFSKRQAQRAIGGLLQSVGENVERVGTPSALTGPIRRGDADTVQEHRRALGRVGAWALTAYDAVLPVIVSCAKAAGLPADVATRLEQRLHDEA